VEEENTMQTPIQSVKYLQPGATGIISVTLDPTYTTNLHGIVVQVNKIAAEFEIVSGEFPVSAKGVELPAKFTVFTQKMHYTCPVIIGKNSSGKTLFIRFDEEAEVKLNRDYFRRDVLIPFLYTETDESLEAAGNRWLTERLTTSRPQFEFATHGEGNKVLNWRGHEVILPHKINLSGGGVRFATDKEIPRGRLLYVNLFPGKPNPQEICAVVEVARSEMFYMTMENREFYNWAKLRLKSDTLYLTAGKFVMIDEKERALLSKYLMSYEE